MLKLRSFALTAILLIGVAVVPVLSQGTLQKRVNFTVNVPFELKKGEAVLPPGNYVLFQISQSDPQLFALFPGQRRERQIFLPFNAGRRGARQIIFCRTLVRGI